MLRITSILLVLFFALGAHTESVALPRIRSVDGAFVDEFGRSVILHGVNLGKKNAPFLPELREPDYAVLADWGMNCVRFYINWAAIEPTPGIYDAAFFEGLDKHIAWANAHGAYVLLDLHQDLYSDAIPGGNGAPAWAVLDDDLPHQIPDGAPWGAAYLTSPKMHRAFDSFWDNRSGPGGVGLQDRFAGAAREVARRYAKTPGVVGIDLLNEPGFGADITKAIPALMSHAYELAALPEPPRGLLTMLASDSGMSQLQELTERKDVYEWAIGTISPLLQTFEKSKLQPFYDRVGCAIREVSDDPILFFEPAGLSNTGAESGTRPLQRPDGSLLVNQAYAPHAYDLVTDTPDVYKPSDMRLSIMFSHLDDHRTQMGLPAVVGEWGGFYGNARARGAAQLVVAHLEHYSLGDLYWDYEKNLAEKAYFDQLCRPYPMAVAGKCNGWRFDQDSHNFTLSWEQPATAHGPTVVYVPKLWFPARPLANIDSSAEITWKPVGDHEAAWLFAVAPSSAGPHTLILAPAN